MFDIKSTILIKTFYLANLSLKMFLNYDAVLLFPLSYHTNRNMKEMNWEINVVCNICIDKEINRA